MAKKVNKQIPISPHFFCDGGGYVLTSSSLGGSNLTPSQVSDLVLNGSADDITPLLVQGICMPILFDGDCALDRSTLFVLGDLTSEQERDWRARLTWKLQIPCGKLILLCSCMAEDLAHAISGRPPTKHFEVFHVIDVPPDLYLVEIYAYPPSLTVAITLNDQEYEEFEKTIPEKDYDKEGNLTSVNYIICLSSLKNEPEMPQLSGSWFDTFTFR